MARLVLVHGAFAGAWKWERLVGPLEDVAARESFLRKFRRG